MQEEKQLSLLPSAEPKSQWKLFRSGDNRVNNIHETRLREMQTPRTGYSTTEPKIFAPPQTPFPGVQDGQNLISWRWSSATNPVWWKLTHAISIYHGNRRTHTHKHTPPTRCKHAHRQDRQQYTAPLSLARSVITVSLSWSAYGMVWYGMVWYGRV